MSLTIREAMGRFSERPFVQTQEPIPLLVRFFFRPSILRWIHPGERDEGAALSRLQNAYTPPQKSHIFCRWLPHTLPRPAHLGAPS